MWSIGKFVRTNEKWSRFSKIRVKGPISKSKKKPITLNCLLVQKSFAKRKQNGYIFTIMLQMIRLWSIFIVMFIQPMLRWRQS